MADILNDDITDAAGDVAAALWEYEQRIVVCDDSFSNLVASLRASIDENDRNRAVLMMLAAVAED